ncbi:MAG: type II secretion system protein GspC [Woeseia sp.]
MTAKWTDFSNLDRERCVAVINQRLPKWIALLLVIAIAWQLARMVWLLIPDPSASVPIAATPAERSAAAASARGAGQPDFQSIADAHLFGVASAEAPPPVSESLADLEETRLNLSLKGTIAAADGAQSIAIIADTRNEEKVYAIDDVVVPGATLHAVFADRVVLNRSGVLEVLKLPQDFPTSAQPVRRATPVATRTTEANPSIQEAITANATKLADVIRPTPYFVAGQQQGYRVYPGRDRRQFAALGLRPGDLIKDIDGQALTDPQQAMEIFQNLGSADQVSVTVERNGQPEVLVLSTSQLAADDDQ